MELQERIKEIIKKVHLLSSRCLPESNIKIDYLTIFSTDDNELQNLNNELSQLGEKQTANNGNKYALSQPMVIEEETIGLIRIRKPDIHRKELGCADISVNKPYEELRALALEKGWDIIVRKGYEMIELSTFDIDTYAYIICKT